MCFLIGSLESAWEVPTYGFRISAFGANADPRQFEQAKEYVPLAGVIDGLALSVVFHPEQNCLHAVSIEWIGSQSRDSITVALDQIHVHFYENIFAPKAVGLEEWRLRTRQLVDPLMIAQGEMKRHLLGSPQGETIYIGRRVNKSKFPMWLARGMFPQIENPSSPITKSLAEIKFLEKSADRIGGLTVFIKGLPRVNDLCPYES